ncbi:F-box protein KIB4 [Cardamine amara subsp. amara]|uniref:F-box protein KIB4 n=1 Tax=Cardamine amara subsp. amara TaxID=228776 RepID=A0ABD1BBK0_CARAN
MSDSEEKTCKDDSEQPTLVMDVVRSILERLSVADFHRARCISSEWYYASKSCIRVTNPWIILKDYDSCLLFDPHENTSYTVRNVAWRSRCLASCGNWFLMVDDRADFYISNVFTRESIPLPPLESIDESPVEFMRINDLNCLVTLNYENKASRESSYIASHLKKGGKKCSYMVSKLRIGKGALYVDEKSRDYVAVWNYDGIFAYHHKKGDDDNNSWKVIQSLKNQGCVDMVFKDGKLYVLCNTGDITVFDFSGGDSPMECASFKTPPSRHYRDHYLVVTLSGEVLIILPRYIDLFDVYKVDHKSLEWSIINSIGDEALLLDQGTTIAAKDGVMKDCIYYTKELDRFKYNDDTRVYNIKTKKVVQVSLPLIDYKYPRPFYFARWF